MELTDDLKALFIEGETSKPRYSVYTLESGLPGELNVFEQGQVIPDRH